jgi:hypothetical protein
MLLPGALGCERRDDDQATPAFMPSWTEARQALESSLSTWRDSPTPLSASPDIAGVQFVDRTRKPNQRLLSFQILGQTDIEYVRQFTVRLNLEGEESPQLIKYNVLGRAPVWVFRLEDYEMIAHWEHNMEAVAPGPPEKPRPAEQPAKPR